MDRATISFPDPVSPVISTDAVEGAAISTWRITSCIAGRTQVARQRHNRLLVAHPPQRAFQQGSQYGRFQRFFDVPVRARFDRLHDAFVATAPGDNDDGNAQNFVAQLFQQVEPVHPRQLDVRQNQAGLKFLEFREGVFAAPHTQNFPIPFA